MRFSTIGSLGLGLLASSATAKVIEVELITGNCENGFGGDNGFGGGFAWESARLVGQGNCDGCSLTTTALKNTIWKSPNPCKPCDSGDRFDYVPNGDGMNVYHEGNGDVIIGNCHGESGTIISCDEAMFGCASSVKYKCTIEAECA